MNVANREMQAKTAVDPLNVCILLMRMECKRFIKQRRLALEMGTDLTRRGIVEFNEVFADISAYNFSITVSEDHYGYQCTVVRNVQKNRVGGESNNM